MADPVTRLNAALEGRYRIESELGEGGMATVYLADDLRHERKVALKVLKPELAAVVGGDRFLAEIKTTANLQHPHILPLFDSGEADGFLFYVMPFVEGESLRDLLEREHQLPIEDALRIASDVAEALAEAHAKGIIHRDIKPENILLHAGRPTIADFGIALAVSAGGGARLTETGLSLGTPHYMSPEQATGDTYVGPATDIYALGCVLYEMLTGEPPYTGASPQVILGRIITEGPRSVAETRSSVPPNVDASIRKALAKLPADRFAGVDGFATALADPNFRHGSTVTAGAGLWNPLSVVLAALLAVLLPVTMVIGWGQDEGAAAQSSVKRYSLALGESNVSGVDQFSSVSLSDDGTKIAYVGADASGPVLWVKRSDQLSPRRLIEFESPRQAIFGAEGERLAVWNYSGSSTELEILSLESGSTMRVADVTYALGGAWADGWIYFTGPELGLERVSEETLQRQRLTSVEEDVDGHGHPAVLPGGVGVLYTKVRLTSLDDAEIAVYDFATDSTWVIAEGVRAIYSDPGTVVVLKADGSVSAAPFEVETLAVAGPFRPVLDGVAVGLRTGHNFALSSSGVAVYTTSETSAGDRELVWVQRDGTVMPFDAGWRGAFESVSISPDGNGVAATEGGEFSSTVWMKPAAGARPFRISHEAGSNRRPTWTPDGSSVAYVNVDTLSGSRVPVLRAADGTGGSRAVVSNPAGVDQLDFSPDGQWVVYRVGFGADEMDLVASRLGTEPEPEPIVISGIPGGGGDSTRHFSRRALRRLHVG